MWCVSSARVIARDGRGAGSGWLSPPESQPATRPAAMRRAAARRTHLLYPLLRCGRRCREAGGRAPQLARADDPVDQAVLDRLLGAEEAVALHVLVHLVRRLAGVAGGEPLPPGAA